MHPVITIKEANQANTYRSLAMDHYSCTSELASEVLMVITSIIIMAIVLYSTVIEIIQISFKPMINRKLSHKKAGIILSLAYALFLPVMSYMFSQAKQNNQKGRAQVFLVWMVLFVAIRVHNGDSTWKLQKSAAQLMRLFWVVFLVYSYTPLKGFKVSLFVICFSSIAHEILKGITLYIAKDSYLLGRNPKLIHSYMKRVMLEDELRTTPMNNCDYIVMGEENHEIAVGENGCLLRDKRTNSIGKLTIGRVFQLNSSEDETFTSAYPFWRDTCVSLSLAKMLRRRFVNLPLDEAGSSKALAFVLEGLIDYIGNNKDILTEGSNRSTRNPVERVFGIIQDELKFVSEFLHTKVPIYRYFHWYRVVDDYIVHTIIGLNLVYLWFKITSIWLSLVSQEAYDHCIFKFFRNDTVVVGFFSYLDLLITVMLAVTCSCIPGMGLISYSSYRWRHLNSVKQYIENPAKWNKVAASMWSKPLFQPNGRNMIVKRSNVKNFEQEIIRYTIFGTKSETMFCMKVHGTVLAPLVKWITKIISKKFPSTIFLDTDVKETILRSLRKTGGQLTNGVTSLKSHGVLEHLNLVCQPSWSTTEAILIWHIATTLFHFEKSSHQQNNNSFKERGVALALSTYCLYLVSFLPELLPDDVEWTERMYQSVRKEIFAIDHSSGKTPMLENRCDYAMRQVTWDEKSAVGKGVKLAKLLVYYADNGIEVWRMLSEFWAEMMLFISPSDNVDAHEEILEREELITQLWALLTHAGILTRPRSTEHPNNGTESYELTEIVIA